ncbi:MAG: 3-dehydroquinate synthase [Chloroflexia bacterium]
MPRVIEVRGPGGTYQVTLGEGLLDTVGAELAGAGAAPGLGKRVVIATDENVARLHGDRVRQALEESGYRAGLVAMQPGEAHKDWRSLDLFIRGFAEHGLDRNGWVLALGGGVVGDTAGLAAALYMRGIALVQAPTTLLAMADASVGGKVAIDHPLGKNMVGVFKQPAAVFADLSMLRTLPPNEIANGMAEVVKAAIIGIPRDPAAGGRLMELLERGAPPSEEMLVFSIEVKRRLVEADPFEQGERALLNLGHTFGHAFELLSGYTLKHGFAVAEGMAVAAHLAERLGLAPMSLTEQTERLLLTYGLPVRWGAGLPLETSAADVLAAMATDKKRRGGGLRFVLARTVGDVRVEADVPEGEVLAALDETRGDP